MMHIFRDFAYFAYFAYFCIFMHIFAYFMTVCGGLLIVHGTESAHNTVESFLSVAEVTNDVPLLGNHPSVHIPEGLHVVHIFAYLHIFANW